MNRFACASILTLGIGGVSLAAQSSTFQFAISATDAGGQPVTDLRAEDVLMSEDGERQLVVKVEPLAVPVRLTIAVDNSEDSADALAHYRGGLAALVQALPEDVEVTLITTAPQPRTVVPATTDRTRILRGINGFAPESARPRFTDALVEYSDRLRRESRNTGAKPYAPVLLMLSTAAVEQTSYQPKQIEEAVRFLVARRARLNVVVMSTRTGQAGSPEALNASLQAMIAMPAVKATNGRYESIASSSRLNTLLPEWGRAIAALHARQSNQVLVTVERKTSGPVQNPRIEIARPGLSGSVSVDGHLP